MLSLRPHDFRLALTSPDGPFNWLERFPTAVRDQDKDAPELLLPKAKAANAAT